MMRTVHTTDDPADWSATEIADAVRGRAISATEVVTAHHLRAQQNAGLGALVSPDWERAYDTAVATDRLLDAGQQVGPLAGVPFTVKDVITADGLPATAASRALLHNRPRHEASAVRRFRQAGAILVGKTNCPEFAFGTTCDSPAFGPTGNPLAQDRSPGGSSGGESVCLATGTSALGLGTDFGGSLRWPAQCTGIVALRPTPGRIPGTGQIPGAGGELGVSAPPLPSPASLQGQLQVIGPLARTVEDLRLALGVASGHDGIDPASAAAGPYAAAPVDTAGLRIGWSDGAHLGKVRQEITALLQQTASALVDHGHTTVAVREVFAGSLEGYNRLRGLDPFTDHLLAIAGREQHVSPATLRSLEDTKHADPRERALAWRDALNARAAALGAFEHVDVVILPVAGGPACALDGSVDVDGTEVSGWELMAHCRAVTMLGTPVVSVPVGRSAEGLPLSVQVIAAPWREDVALAVAAELSCLRPPSSW
jgi:amidase